MAYAMPGTPTIMDTDNDGFIDLAYMGDLGGNVWRFRFCLASDGGTCGTSSWTGSTLFSRGSGAGPVYAAPSATRDVNGNVWIYWGTGDKTEPIVVGTQTDRFYALKDATLSGTYTLGNLENITSGTYTDSTSKRGWYIDLSGAGEKCLSEASIFAGQVYFTSYTPAGGAGDPCSQAGTAKIYAVSYLSGAGSLLGGQPEHDARRGHPHGTRSVHEPLCKHARPLRHGERRGGNRRLDPEGEYQPAHDRQQEQHPVLEGPADSVKTGTG